MKYLKETQKITLVTLIVGFFVGYMVGDKPEKAPYTVWEDQDNCIQVVQEANSHVYSFCNTGDGNYELIATMSPDSGLYPSQARSPLPSE
jgi:hypothetical protein